ncbi:MAG TPA: NUDIX domain-containing protein [Candidatus Nanoarchaeia archaeon]|nr:NUDIX domain-containing protein [Candidatus Nanoarchaeia archaeon]
MKRINPCAIIINKKGELLLQLRDIEPEKGKWVLFGGRLEDNESEEETCKREIKEELNYEIKSLKFFKTYEDEKTITPIFIIQEQVEINQLKLQEGSAMKFFKPGEIKNLDIGFNQKDIILEFLK